MLRVIPYPPPRSLAQGDRMAHHHLHPQPPHHSQHLAVLAKPAQQLTTPATVARVYRTCTNLFLTRRLPDALATLTPVIIDSVSPRVKCSRALRTKVWSLYFAIMDAAVKMGAGEGRKVWGAAEWGKITARVRSGAVWDEAIAAYGGEGRIDGDVVNALVTLLLTHSQDQTVTQKKIEAYLSAAPNFLSTDDDTKGVVQRVKLVELYILHVLPRVNDWEYAREFTHMSGDLDDEQKEIFQTTLDQLQKDSEDVKIRAAELESRRVEEWEQERVLAEEDRSRIPSSPPSVSGGGRSSSKMPNGRIAKDPKASSVRGNTSPNTKIRKETPAVATSTTSTTTTTTTTTTNAIEKASVAHGRGRVAKGKSDSANLFRTTTALLNRLQAQMGTASGRFAMLRAVIMVAVVVWMTSKRKVRERVRRLLMLAWIKTTRTVGMGMKVTYI